MELTDVLKERYSVRSYLDKVIEEDKLMRIYEAGIVAPTAKNKQPIKVLVVKSKDGLEKINRVSKCIYGAPVVMIVCYDKDEAWTNNLSGVSSGVQDASIVTTHMMLEAWNIGIGSCWINMFDADALKKEFDLDESLVPVCLLDLGYPSDESKPIELHFSKKDINEVFYEL